ncbi:MAG: CinA family nicotinamide mononucleotide deamidase-related protein, partial [Caldilineaceae bacterium]
MGETHPGSGLVAEIVTTGTEILLGDIVDTNAAWIAQQLREVGVNLYYKSTVGDNEERLRALLEMGIGRSDVIILTGGLGPTVDDITRLAVANATQRPLRLNRDAMEALEARFARFGSKMTENNRQQAYIPEGATMIANPVGTAPGFIAEAGRCAIVALPGVPSEMKHLMNETVLPWLRQRAGGAVIRRRILRTIGIGESTIDSLLDDLERQSNPTVGLAAHTGQADVRIAARAGSPDAAEAMLDATEAEVRRRIGDYIYSTTPGETFEAVVSRRLKQHGLTVALFESNTGGAIARRLAAADAEGAPVVAALVATDPKMPVPLGKILAQSAKPAEEVVRRAAAALRDVTGASINIAIIGTTGESEGIYGTQPGETWMAEADRRSTQAARLPVGGTDAFTTIRIGNYALRMIDDGITEL